MTPRDKEKWLREHGSFIRVENLMKLGVNIVWNTASYRNFNNTSIYFDITGKTREDAMDILLDYVMGYLYDLILANGDMRHFSRSVRVNLI